MTLVTKPRRAQRRNVVQRNRNKEGELFLPILQLDTVAHLKSPDCPGYNVENCLCNFFHDMPFPCLGLTSKPSSAAVNGPRSFEGVDFWAPADLIIPGP